MKALPSILVALIAGLLAGCGTERAPQFVVSSDTDSLVKSARDAVEAELVTAFGTPADLVVWPDLKVDFGSFTGTVKRQVINTPGALIVADFKSESGDVAAETLDSIRGAAILLVGEDAPIRRVVAVSAEGDHEYRVQIVDEHGVPADPGINEGEPLTVIGDGLQKGRSLYSRHCMHCHGSSGDGDGPTAKYFNVRPRDYRKGIYKFTSTGSSVLASRDDLYRIVKLGVPGTYMPSFMLLPDSEVKSLVEYIRWLSMRGQLEAKLVAALKTDFPKTRLEKESASDVKKEFDQFWAESSAEELQTAATDLAADWSLSEEADSVVVPKAPRVEATAESVARGRAIFMGSTAKCASCHGESARGNGPSTELVNDLPGQPGVKGEKPGLYDAWGNIVKPRDLTLGIYRGGRRPIDVFRRISEGIKGTPMQAFGKSLKEDQIWDVVNYVLSVPYQDK